MSGICKLLSPKKISKIKTKEMNGSKTKHLAHVKMKMKFEILNIRQNCLGQKEVGSATYWCYPAEKRSECSNESHAALGELEMFQGEEFQC